MRSPLSSPGEDLVAVAREIRSDIIDALWACGGGHYGGSLSVVDILVTLYYRFLRVSSERPRDPGRDRLVFSKGHAAIALYAVLRRLRFFDYPLSDYGQAGSPLEGHPDMCALPGVDFSTGSLGQGLSVGLGMALALAGSESRVWVVLGDGECQEGQVWEAAMLAARLGTDNLVAIVDANGHQEWGFADVPGIDAAPIVDTVAKWSAFGWSVVEVDGHSHEHLSDALDRAMTERGAPWVIIARTTKGRGYPLLEGSPRRFHCATLSADEHRQLEETG